MMTSSRGILGIAALIAALLVVAACAPAAAPTPTAAPAKPTTAPAAKPAATASPAAKPAATASAKPAASSDWQAEWDKVVAAAKKEGKVVVAGRTGDSPRQAVQAFERAYPEIRLEWNGVSGSTFAPKVIGERQGGLYLWDVHLGGAISMVKMLIPEKVLDPLKPALILPEVVDDSKWLGGLDNWWQDAERQRVFGFEAGVVSSIYVNRGLVSEAELSNHDQLLDPKWKGKIASIELSRPGSGGAAGAWMLKVKGEAWFRKFLEQLVIKPDERQVMESVIRGTQPIMVMVPTADFAPFEKQGLTKSFEPLDPGAEVSQWLTSGASHIALVNRAPNPNAAKVFLNWALSREGQQAYTDATGAVSARLDVTGGDPINTPKPGVKYPVYDTMEMENYTNKAYAIAKEVTSGQ